MRLTLLGTGSADGWPNAFCTCDVCASAVAAGRIRTPTSVLVDDTVLLDCGPEAPRQAVRAGATLSGLRLLWVGHDHPDHASPMALLSRSWARSRRSTARAAPLTVAGSAATLASWRDWVGPDDEVDLVPVTAGREIEVAGYRLLPLAAAHGDDALVAQLTAPDGTRVLYASDTGPLPGGTVAALRGSQLDAVLLEETFGDRPDLAARGDHLDLVGFADQVALLRDVGAVVDRTFVVAVHLSHHNPHEAAMAVQLSACGARAGRDGEVLDLGRPHSRPGAGAAAASGHRTLILGGARSGKSTAAERLLRDEPDVDYAATGYPADPADPEWAARVATHRARRPAAWRTYETIDLVALLGTAGPPLIVDCFTLWLTRTLDEAGAWDPAAAPHAVDEVAAAITDVVAAWRDSPRRVVAVSNEVGSGVVPDTHSGRLFRDLQGRLNAELAAVADDMLLMVAGRTLRLDAQPVAPIVSTR